MSKHKIREKNSDFLAFVNSNQQDFHCIEGVLYEICRFDKWDRICYIELLQIEGDTWGVISMQSKEASKNYQCKKYFDSFLRNKNSWLILFFLVVFSVFVGSWIFHIHVIVICVGDDQTLTS
eukprot:TRINITY_DN6600_c2_g1_i1.p2 TRINITY_DN6600_c2_g1~~TRINITY_DN6600_c2_g1_i1.p2  ORF type:complete len:130 (-),score=9.58 TRINITY_DN6600_c2_g1_i1:2-367(-)